MARHSWTYQSDIPELNQSSASNWSSFVNFKLKDKPKLKSNTQTMKCNGFVSLDESFNVPLSTDFWMPCNHVNMLLFFVCDDQPQLSFSLIAMPVWHCEPLACHDTCSLTLLLSLWLKQSKTDFLVLAITISINCCLSAQLWILACFTLCIVLIFFLVSHYSNKV